MPAADMRYEPRTPDASVNVSEGGQAGEFVRLLVGFAVALLTVVVSAFLVVDVGVRFVDADLENRWFAGRFPIGAVPAEAGERGVAAATLLRRLASHWPAAPYAFELRVTDDAEHNALALPGGTIVVTRGLLDTVDSENELAFVLGHELGHFHGRDHLRGLGRGVVLTVALGAIGMGSAGDLASMLASATLLGFGREQERAADAYGLSLVLAEYGHAADATRFFRRIEAAHGEEAQGPPSLFAGWMSTHPLSAERVRDIERAIDRAGARADGAVVPLPAVQDVDSAHTRKAGEAGEAGEAGKAADAG